MRIADQALFKIYAEARLHTIQREVGKVDWPKEQIKVCAWFTAVFFTTRPLQWALQMT